MTIVGRRCGIPALHRLGKPGRVVEPIIVHVGDARRKRRVVHQDRCRPRRLRRERGVEPSQPLGAQHPVMPAGDQRIERDKPQRVILDRVLQIALGREVAVTAERLAQWLAGVMVAGNDKDRHLQRCKQGAQVFVLLGRAMID